MKRSIQESRSVWFDNGLQGPSLPILQEPINADVCVVGAGIAGLTTAYLLQKAGKSVVVLDAWDLAAGETCRTTAHLTTVLDDRFFNLESIFGEDKARIAVESHMTAVNRIEAIISEEAIDCDFERLDGYLIALNGEQKKDFDKEAEASMRVGFTDREILSGIPISGINISHPAMRFPRQACFHILKYMLGLAEAFQKNGGQIFTRAHVKEVKGGKNAYVKTDNDIRVSAGSIVVATNTPINDRVRIHTKQAAYRTYVVGFEIAKDAYPNFLIWDMEDPYHYARIVRGSLKDTLIVGGEDHKTGQDNDYVSRYKRIEAWAGKYFANLGPVTYRWSGQVMEPVDSLAFIGRNPLDDDNVYIATGDSGNGMTHGTIAGILLTDLIMGRENPWAEIYDPSRKSLKSIGTYIEENANVVGCMVKGWAESGEVKSADEIPMGEGAIMRDGASKIAVYKDEQGQLHQCSAVCTHLGCIVQWNSGEKSWDCPCHGSRYGIDGQILNGPAIKPLSTNLDVSYEKELDRA
jgi:glycine/D-amino acid oxidase-like deaminating enzyme/nitrite reductase/ring-hydroxylating ferredoxin subunit